MISDFEMHPLEFRLVQTHCAGIRYSAAALNSQYLQLSNPAAWALHSAHAMGKGKQLDYLSLRG